MMDGENINLISAYNFINNPVIAFYQLSKYLIPVFRNLPAR